MCDYSLMSVPNRLAKDGEELISHRFPGGTIGLVSIHDVRPKAVCEEEKRRGFWSQLWSALTAVPESVTAVCVPPGSSLLLADIPGYIQREFGFCTVERVVFTQIGAMSNSYRDAFRFGNGREILLQRFTEGMRALVLATSLEEEQTMHAVAQNPAG